VAELTLAAEVVKAARGGLPGRAMVYWNEACDPVVNSASDASQHPASALCAVPAAVDWVSLNF
jgi:hypothetical protein